MIDNVELTPEISILIEHLETRGFKVDTLLLAHLLDINDDLLELHEINTQEVTLQ